MTFSSSSTQSLYSPRGEKGSQLDRYSRVHFQRAITTLPTIIRQRYLEGKYYIFAVVLSNGDEIVLANQTSRRFRSSTCLFGLLSNSSFTLGYMIAQKEKLISLGRRRRLRCETCNTVSSRKDSPFTKRQETLRRTELSSPRRT